MFVKQPQLHHLTEAIREGYGQGRGDRYRTFLPVRRGRSSKVSYQHLVHLPVRRPNVHLMSKLEYRIALPACWLQPLELREGFPLWPVSHRHPNYGWNPELDASLGYMPGLYELARQAGIDHGFYVGTKLPYVATTDLVFLVRVEDTFRLVFISCKPSHVLKRSARARERVELDRIYAAAAQSRHVVATEKDVNLMLCANLEWICPLRSEVIGYGDTAVLRDFARHLQSRLDKDPIEHAVAHASRSTVRDKARAHQFFRLAAWLGLIDIDLTKPLVMSEFAHLGGWNVRASLAFKFWGV